MLALKVNGLRDARVPIGVLLPHEVLHCLAICDGGHHCFQSIFFGNLPPEEVARFWRHVKSLGPWKNHPHLNDPTVTDHSKLVGIQFHADGAEFYRDDECFCYSWSSIFASAGLISDVMLYRFPMLLIHERHMQQENVTRLVAGNIFLLVCLPRDETGFCYIVWPC